MSAPIYRHQIAPDPDNDPSHPIPYLGVLDVAAYLKSGGANLSIIVASPLDASERSQKRLLDKIQGYLGYISSSVFREHAGADPSPENTTIEVVLHPESDPEISSLLVRCRHWVSSNNASLIVRELTGPGG
jgi:hypothetical protein